MNGFVQRLKHLHVLVGLFTGWLLLLIIFSGSLSFYRAELDNIQLFKFAATPEFTAAATAQSASLAQSFLVQHAATATQWYIELPQARRPYLTLHWLQPAATGQGNAQLYQQLLDAESGKPLTPTLPIKFGATDHQLGGLFFQLHYNLLQLFGPISRSLVAYLALLWLLLSIAGLLSLRGRWRTSWQIKPSGLPPETARTLRHNQLALLTLPFALLFASSGWLTQMFSDNPAPQRQLYPEQPYQFYAEFFPPAQPFAGARQNNSAPLPDLAALVGIAEQQLALPVGKISLTLPGTVKSTVLLSGSAAAQVSNQLPNILFRYDASGWQQALQAQSEVDVVSPSQTPIAQIRSVWYGLHQSLYAASWLRFGLFLSGILCCWMIWLGLRNWLQRQPALIWQRWVLTLTAIGAMSLAISSVLLVLLQLVPTALLFGWPLSQQLLVLMLATGSVLFVASMSTKILLSRASQQQRPRE